MKKERQKPRKVDIREHRFVPECSTTSKIFVDKRTKGKSRNALKKRLKDEDFS